MLALIVVAAYATLFVSMPRWLSILLSVGFLGIGLLFVLFGAIGSLWDRQMTPGSDHGGTQVLVAGVLLLLSRARLVFRVVMEALTSASP